MGLENNCTSFWISKTQQSLFGKRCNNPSVKSSCFCSEATLLAKAATRSCTTSAKFFIIVFVLLVDQHSISLVGGTIEVKFEIRWRWDRRTCEAGGPRYKSNCHCRPIGRVFTRSKDNEIYIWKWNVLNWFHMKEKFVSYEPSIGRLL